MKVHRNLPYNLGSLESSAKRGKKREFDNENKISLSG
jgi:hypothetical protein